jgi:hypothetical protein
MENEPPRWWDVIPAQRTDLSAIYVALTDRLDVYWLDEAEIMRRTGLAEDLVRSALESGISQGLIARHPARPELFAEIGFAQPILSVQRSLSQAS